MTPFGTYGPMPSAARLGRQTEPPSVTLAGCQATIGLLETSRTEDVVQGLGFGEIPNGALDACVSQLPLPA